MTNQEKIDRLKDKMEEMAAELNKYEKYFLENDGRIDEREQVQLDSMHQNILAIQKELRRRSRKPAKAKKAKSNKVPTTVEQFVAYCKTKNISTGNKIKIDKTIDISGTDMKIEIKANPTIVICPAPAIKGKISIRLKGIEKALKKEMGMESGFEYDFDNHNSKLDFEAEEVFKIELNNADGVTTVYIEVNIMTIITGAATKFLEELTGGVLKLTTNGIMSIKGKWDSKGFELVKVGGAIALGVKADFNKNEEIKEKLGKYSPVIEASAAIDINTEYNGDKMDVTTAEGKTIVKVKMGGFDYEFTQEGKGEAIGSEAERMAAIEGALLLAMQAATKEVDLSDKSMKYQTIAARKVNATFVAQYSGNRKKIEEKIKAKLADYYLVDQLLDVFGPGSVNIAHQSLIKKIYRKDKRVQKVLKFLSEDRQLYLEILPEEKAIAAEESAYWRGILQDYNTITGELPVNLPFCEKLFRRLKEHNDKYSSYDFYTKVNRRGDWETAVKNVYYGIVETKKMQGK